MLGIICNSENILLKQKTEGTERVLVGLELIERGVIRDNFKIFKDGIEIGFVTSGGFSPTLKKSIGLGLIKKKYKEVGTDIDIKIRKKLLKGKVASTPFYRNV